MWCIEGTLKATFLELYRIACVQDAFVADNFRRQGECVHWEVTFSIWPRIGNWSLSPPFWGFFTQPLLRALGKIGYGGSPQSIRIFR